MLWIYNILSQNAVKIENGAGRGREGAGLRHFSIKDQLLIFCFDASEKEMRASFFFINSRPKEPGPQLQAIAEEAFCR